MSGDRKSHKCKVILISIVSVLVIFQLLFIFSDLKETIDRGRHPDIPSHLQEFILYEDSSKKALQDLRAWIHTHGLSLPLFPNRLQSPSLPGKEPPKICVAISTAIRSNSAMRYLIQSVSGLLNRMNFNKFKERIYIHVFSVESRVDLHTELSVVAQFVPVTLIKSRVSEDPIPRKYQEELDTSQIYRSVHQLGCQYSIFIEDDALAKTNWVESLLLAIKQIEEYTGHRNQHDPPLAPWLLVKLYCARPAKFDACPAESISNGYYQDFNLVAAMINREYLLPLADFFETTVLNALKEKNFDLYIAKDIQMETFRRDKGLAGFCFEPVIFQHTGIFSSVVERDPDRSSVKQWYMKAGCFMAESEPIEFNEAFWAS